MSSLHTKNSDDLPPKYPSTQKEWLVGNSGPPGYALLHLHSTSTQVSPVCHWRGPLRIQVAPFWNIYCSTSHYEDNGLLVLVSATDHGSLFHYSAPHLKLMAWLIMLNWWPEYRMSSWTVERISLGVPIRGSDADSNLSSGVQIPCLQGHSFKMSLCSCYLW